MIFDTIVAKSTAHGIAALNIIRVSGPDAIPIVNTVFKGKNLMKAKSHQIIYGHIVDYGEQIDEVMVAIFREPKSFTKENMVEISCHGGNLVVLEIIRVLIRNGARLAKEGEFSKRAYLNGRIDLTMAESIMDIVNAKTTSQNALAQKSLQGQVRTMVETLQNDLLNLIGVIEINIDYPEYDDVYQMTHEVLKPRLETLLKQLDEVLLTSQQGKIIREGLSCVIVGKPNVGKSSLLNTLLKEERAIVTEISGTTRDLIEAEINLEGILVKLIDTAGIRKTKDYVESIGIDRAKKAIHLADLVLLVIDKSDRLSELDYELLEITKNKKRIIVGNKIDLGRYEILIDEPIIDISVKKQLGIDDLFKKIKTLFFEDNINDSTSILLSNTRHIAKTQEASDKIKEALNAIKDNVPVDMIVIDLHSSWEALGDITGLKTNDVIIDHLFSTFCVGK